MTGPKTPLPRKDTRPFKSIANILAALVALCALASLLLYTHTRAAGTTFYSQGSLPPEALVSWNTSRTGGGTSPLNFTSGDTFVIQNTHNMGTAVAWTVSGTGATVEIESGATLTANNIVAVPNFQVDNGGTYVHNAASGTANGTASDVPGSASRTFGATSTVEFQKWANGGTGPAALPSGVSWGNLKINVATLAGSWSQGGNLTGVQGNLTIQSAGGTTREFRLGASTSPTLTIGGDLIISGGVLNLTSGAGTPTVNLAGNYNQSGGTLTSTGSGIATINFTGGASLVAFTQSAGTLTDTTINWSIANGKTVQLNNAFALAASRTFTINSGGVLLAAATITNSGTMSVNGEFRLTDGGFATGNNFTYGANGTLGFTTAGGYFVDSTHVYWPAANGPFNVNVIFGGITLNATRTVGGLFQTSSGVALSNSTLTLNGTCQINDGGFFNNPPTYGASSLLKYNISSSSPSYGRNNEWSPGATGQPGYPANVQLSNQTTLNLANGSNNAAFQMSGSLTIDSGTTLDMGALTQPLTVPGDLSLSGTLKLSSATGGDFKLGGNWTRAAAGTFTPNSRAVFFNGAGAQTVTVTGGGTQAFDYLVVDKSGGNLSPAGHGGDATNLSVTQTTGNVLQIVNTGGIDLNGQTLAMSGGGGSLLVSGGARNIVSSFLGGTFALTGSKTVTSASGGTLSFSGGVIVSLSAGVDFGAGLSTVNGTLKMGSGGFVNTNPPSYGPASTLLYDCACTYARAAEWTGATGLAPGVPNDVTANTNTTVDLGSTSPGTALQAAGSLDAKSGGRFVMSSDDNSHAMTATLTVMKNVLVESGGTLRLSAASGGDLNLQGDFTNDGTFTTNNRAVYLEGGATQNLADASGTLTMPYVRVNKSGGTVLLQSNLTALAPSGGDSMQFLGTTNTVTLNGKTLTLGSTVGTPPAGSGFVGDGSASLSLQDGGAGPGNAMGTVAFVGGAETLNNLTVNRTGASGSVTLGSPVKVGGTLALTAGLITTGANTLTVDSAATVTRTSGYINGTEQKNFVNTSSFTFDVGTANGYSPVDAGSTVATGNGSLSVKPTQTKQPNVPGTNALSRYWTLSGTGVTTNLTFHYLAGDVAGTESNYEVFKYDGSFSVPPNQSVNAAAHTATVSGVNSFSDWTLAEASSVSGDYAVSTTGGAIVVTDVSGHGDPFNVAEPAAGHIKFGAAGRTFLIDGTTIRNDDSGSLSLSGINSVTINLGDGDDTANVGSFTGNFPSLIIHGDAGSDTVNFGGQITFAPNAGLNVDLRDDAGTGFVNVGGQLITSGSGPIGVSASTNVTVSGGGKLQTQSGSLQIEANQQGTSTVGTSDGVDIIGTVQTADGTVGITGTGSTGDGADIFGVKVADGGKVLATGSGNILINGTGGARAGGDNTDKSNYGVFVYLNGSLVSSASGLIHITGTGGATNAAGSYGVVVAGGRVETDGAGALAIEGTGGTVTGGEAGPVDSAGIFVIADDVAGDGGVVTSTGTGDIIINGTSGPAGAGAGQGIRVDNPGTVTTVDGSITMNGTGGACGNACLGTSIRGPVTATGAGAINITGTGGTTNGAFPVHGLNVRSGGAVTTKDGDITVTGTGGSGSTTNDDAGFNLAPTGTGTLQTTGNGNVVVNADRIVIRTTTAATIDAGANAVTFKQKTAGTAINLGSTVDTTPGTVELSNAELARVTAAGTINFGDTSSGAITVSAAITRTLATNLNLSSGANIDIAAGTITSAGGNVSLNPGTNTFADNSGVDVNSGAGALTLAAAKDLNVVINGTTADTQYTQLNVAGLVNLNGANLALSGSPSPSPGQQFVVVNNDGADAITGTFNGLPEGATIPNFLGSAFDAKITYAGGDGNDAVLTVVAPVTASFSIDDVTQAEGNSGTTDFVFTVTKTGAGAASVDFFTADGSATAGEDYQSDTGTLSFASGDTTKTVTVHVNGDTTYERDETFSVNLTNASGATIADNQGLGTITNDDAPPSTLVVNTTDDQDFGACLAEHCSLREAINAANFSGDTSTINFKIPAATDTGCDSGTGVCTMAPSSDLPAVTAGPTIIDGYTQTGASANNATTASNAVLKIVLSGANDTGGTGLELTNSTVRGLVINDFGGNGLVLHAGNTVAGNFVGTDDAGAAALANDTGVHILDNNNTVGGTTPADRNVVSGNNLGIFSDGTDGISTGVVIAGNLVGTNPAGDTALGNFVGVEVCNGSTNVLVGGSTSASANVISGNAIYNVLIDSSVTHDNKVQGNLVGPKADGTGALAPGTATTPNANAVKSLNAGVARRLSAKAAAQFSRLLAARAPSPNAASSSGYGVLIDTSGGNTVGGTSAGEGNTIAFNSGKGVAFTGTTQVAVLGNSVHDNGDLGIDGGDDGVTPNDSPDSDGLTNFPVIDSALVTGSTLTVSGSLHAEASTEYRLEFFTNASCDPSGNGEGETFVGTTDVTTDGGGDATFTFHPSSLTAGQSVTATATNTSSNSTSEFSACATAQAGSAGTIEFSQTNYSVAENAGVAHITIKRVGGSDGSVSATFSTSDGTATTADNDYVAVAGQTVTFADGDTADKTVDVTVNDDSTYETDETVNLSLSGTTVNRPGIGSGPSVSSVVSSATLTITNDDAPPSLSIDDVTQAEGNSGTTDFVFTVTKTGATEVNASVNFATQDGTATVADNDYQATSGTLTFLPADTTKTVTVHVNGDTTPETDETFTAHLFGETDATASHADGTGTIQNDDESASAGQFLISEFRLRGPGSSAPVTAPANAKTKRKAISSSSSSSSSGGTGSSTSSVRSPNAPDTSPQANDEFVELYNNTDSPLLVTTTDGSKGWALAASDGVVRFVVPNGTVIPARGHFLGVNTLGYSLGNYPSGNDGSSETTATGDPVLLADGTPASGYTLDIPDNAGIAVFRTVTPANFSTATRLDAVGSTSEANTLYKEGAGYPALSPSDIAQNLEGSFYRSLCSFVGGVGCATPGVPKNTGDNSQDFLFVDTEGTQTAAGQRLGAPGPENLSSPVQRNSSLGFNLLDRSVSSALAPNRVRNPGDHTNPNSTFGTLSIRRRVTNTTAANVTRLRFRIVEVTTFPAPPGVADLRALSSGDVPGGVANVGDSDTCAPSSAPCTVAVRGTTLEEPPAQSSNGGGGFNSSLKVGTVTLATPLQPGQSVNIQFLLGVQQTGSFRFLINIEALP